jgi:hypothetical protein
VLDRLERADGTAKLLPHHRVLDTELETALRAADLLGGERDPGEVEREIQGEMDVGPIPPASGLPNP